MDIAKHLAAVDEKLYDTKVEMLSQLLDQLEGYHSMEDIPQQMHLVMDLPKGHGDIVATPDKAGITIEEPDEGEIHRVGLGRTLEIEDHPGEKESFSAVEKEDDCHCGGRCEDCQVEKDAGAGGGPFVEADSPITRKFPTVDLMQKEGEGVGFNGTALGVAGSGFVDTGGQAWNSKKKINTTEFTGPISKSEAADVAGLAVVAEDTGRVLLQQRALSNDDKAAGMWEFPGGHLEQGEKPIDAAVREWEEETGAKLPKGKVVNNWVAPNGYNGFVYAVPSENDVPINLDSEDRRILNPDDPDRDNIETIAFWDPKQMKNNPALRREMRGMDVDILKSIEQSFAHLKIMKGGDDRYIIYGLASSSVLDKQGHVISNRALQEAVPKFMNSGYNLVSVFHSDIIVGRVVPEFMAPDGTLYRTEVDEDGWWIVCELRKDIVASQNLIKEIEKGQIDAFSIAGNALSHHIECASHGCFTTIDSLEIYEVSACLLESAELVTNKGAVKIPDISVGDLVYTHKNRYRPVTEIMSREIDEEIYDIYVGDVVYSFTSEHPIYVQRKVGKKLVNFVWIKACEIVEGDILVGFKSGMKAVCANCSGEIIVSVLKDRNYCSGRCMAQFPNRKEKTIASGDPVAKLIGEKLRGRPGKHYGTEESHKKQSESLRANSQFKEKRSEVQKKKLAKSGIQREAKQSDTFSQKRVRNLYKSWHKNERALE